MRFSCLVPAAALALAPARGVAAPGSPIHTVFLILMENHSWSQIQGQNSAPYINGTLLPMASHAEQYYNPPGNHPSLPNYLWLEAGTNFGILDDNPPRTNHQSTAAHLVTLLQNAGIAWKSYQEDISGSACPLTAAGLYAPKHNPMVYFDDVTGANNTLDPYCLAHVRAYAELASDLANNTVAQYNFITPNLCDDMHDCDVATGDTWLSREVPRILSSQAYQNGGAIFITWDESEGGDFPVGMIVLSLYAKGNGYANTIHYTHGSTLRTIEEIFGVTPLLGDAANAADLGDLLTIRLVETQAALPVNAASLRTGAVAPGEIITILGSGLSAAQVRFDGMAAATLFQSDQQINAVVPYGIGGSSAAYQLVVPGPVVDPLPIPLASSAPGIFTADFSGQGTGAILNADGSANSPLNPAGQADLWIEPTAKPWDLAPLKVIAEEAGGRFFNFDGGSSIYGGNCAISTPGLEAMARRFTCGVI